MQLKTKRRIRNGLIFATVIYILGGLALWFLQEKIFFHPKQIRPGDAFQFNEPHKEENVQVDASSVLNFVKFYPADPASKKGIVLYFHGNRENINRYAAASLFFTKHGYEVWMPDYPGFGKSTGNFSEERLYNDADVLYKLALKN
ncbi:MAG: alpha/beta hydrolase, partial [Chitinophagaceae bacterium]|nr:alpha/beta hydrolase [Chitinophagaceae bacterium]